MKSIDINQYSLKISVVIKLKKRFVSPSLYKDLQHKDSHTVNNRTLIDSKTMSTSCSISVEEKYTKKTQLEHILDRPDTYIGDVEPIMKSSWVIKDEELKWEEISYSPGFYKLFDEILVNATDNVVNDKTCNAIDIIINPEENLIVVKNNGEGIEIQKHSKYDMWVIELIMGNLLTGSNYNDSEERTTGGRNGFGAKLTNAFSKEFTVSVVNQTSRKSYVQTWNDNMSRVSKPIIKDVKSKSAKIKSYTQISYQPDLERFKMDKISEDVVNLFRKRAYDAAALSGAKVTFNGEPIQIKNFKQYVKMYCETLGSLPPVFEENNDRWVIGVSHLPGGEFKQISYVNGISTNNGGTHVSNALDKIIKKLMEIAKTKHKKITIKPNIIKEQIIIFVNSTIVNPSFSSQTKDELTTKSSNFGSTITIGDPFIKNVVKLGIFEQILLSARIKEMSSLDRNNGKKINKLRINKLDDANYAGSKRGHECTLILTEGDSAKTFAIAGFSVIGRDHFGVFPLKGKPLNVREANNRQLTDNEELNNLIKILGLQYNKTYNDDEIKKSLRYGKLMILADQDVDGSHIKGLVINIIDHFWPSLLKTNFLQTMSTPIVKASLNNEVHIFIREQHYHQWSETVEDITRWKIKYYKGLGTSTSQEAKECFQGYKEKVININHSEDDQKSVDLAFNKKRTNERKKWLLGFNKDSILEDSKFITTDEFINKELICFSNEDNMRSLPHVVDGLKPSQRKVLYGTILRNAEVKVAQLAGFVSDKACYHHGEMSLNQAIINMAQNFVGSNNINLLEPNGQFGTRLSGGKDSASPRYIWTQLSSITSKIFLRSDNPVLEYCKDDGIQVEPIHYLPIIPLLLVNGSQGIGTGYSCDFPCFNPKDLIQNIRRCLKNQPLIPMVPWYRNFEGSIVNNGKAFETIGCFELKDDDKIIITELPIWLWKDKFMETLNRLESDKKIDYYMDNCTDTKIHITIYMDPKVHQKMTVDKVIDMLKLKTTKPVSISNMHAYDPNGKIKKYNSAEEIMEDFYQVRLQGYGKRKENLLTTMREQMVLLGAMIRFIEAKLSKKLKIDNISESKIVDKLSSLGLPKLKMNKTIESYDYLLDMSQRSMTKEKIEELRKKHKHHMEDIKKLEVMSLEDLWEQDLDTLETMYDKYLESNALKPIEVIETKVKKKSKKKGKVEKKSSNKKKQ